MFIFCFVAFAKYYYDAHFIYEEIEEQAQNHWTCQGQRRDWTHTILCAYIILYALITI